MQMHVLLKILLDPSCSSSEKLNRMANSQKFPEVLKGGNFLTEIKQHIKATKKHASLLVPQYICTISPSRCLFSLTLLLVTQTSITPPPISIPNELHDINLVTDAGLALQRRSGCFFLRLSATGYRRRCCGEDTFLPPPHMPAGYFGPSGLRRGTRREVPVRR